MDGDTIVIPNLKVARLRRCVRWGVLVPWSSRRRARRGFFNDSNAQMSLAGIWNARSSRPRRVRPRNPVIGGDASDASGRRQFAAVYPQILFQVGIRKTQEGDVMSYDSEGTTSESDRPLTWAELRDQLETFEAAEEADVPENLSALWSDLADPGDAKAVFIDKGMGADDPIQPQRPDWVGSTLRPKAPPRPRPPRLELRGVPFKPLIIYPPDDRNIYSDLRYPWVCVCHIQGRVAAGSGVIVGPRHVLTASHVVDWGGPAEVIQVHRAGSAIQATARTFRRMAFTKLTSDPTYSTIDEDYAVLVTDQRLGDRFGSLGVRTYDSSWDDENVWWNIGYAGDIPTGAAATFPYFQRDKKMDEDEWDYGSGRAMTTAADFRPRQSGSPMFGFWTDGPYVVAVAAAVGEIVLSGEENWCSGGSDLTRLVREAIASFP
ncbi:trypsin-like serine peptidase [Nocardia cyriacigeorgica]|uniref:trypsin-like serine peptidase n=1 Tax=Nocardia cyriacigeorgica TaxID=135487 RepID=UPI002454B180|nr:serine protease [Nocardia cyriacigeorgica]